MFVPLAHVAKKTRRRPPALLPGQACGGMQRFLMYPSCMVSSFEVNLEPHTGARPSVRFCAWLIKTNTFFLMQKETQLARYALEGTLQQTQAEIDAGDTSLLMGSVN